MNSFHQVTLAATAALAAACGVACRSAIAPVAAIPAGTQAIAGVDFDRLRAAPLYPRIRASLPSFAALDRASSLLFAWRRAEILAIEQGRFREPPAGATMLAPGLALSGAPGILHDAAAQYRSGHTGAPDLLAHMPGGGSQVWIVARGGVNLPVHGNAENINRLLREADFVTLAARAGAGLDIEATGTCTTDGAATRLEETLRAAVSLAAANARAEIAALLGAIRIRRDGRKVYATLAAGPQAAELLLREIGPAAVAPDAPR